MSDKVEKLEIKKLIQEYNFLLIDDEYKKEIISENKIEFLEKIQNLKKNLGLIYDYEEEADDKQNENSTKEETNEKSVKEGEENDLNEKKTEEGNELQKKPKIDPDTIGQSTKDKIKKLYREIVKKTHPDRTDSEKLIDFYLKATIATDEYNLFELFIICIELGIDIDIDKEDREVLVKLVNLKKNELRNIELSFIWMYANSKTEEEKNKLVELFVQKHGKKN